MAAFTELEDRVVRLERLLLGEDEASIGEREAGHIDHHALPMHDIAKALAQIGETNEGRKSLEERSVTPRELGKVPYARLKSTAGQLLPNVTHTLLTFDTKISDNFDQTATAGPFSRITFRIPGIYIVHLSVAWDDLPAAPLYKITITRNTGGVYVNTAELNSDEKIFPATAIQSHNCTVVRHFSAGDHVEAWGFQGAGGPWSTYAEGGINERYPSFSAAWVGNFDGRTYNG